ncbi:MAG: hypothetical protein RSE16_02955 [Sphingobium sp.]|nr:MAG: hypothetical protein RSE16_02955 [Sphingobium sp.]
MRTAFLGGSAIALALSGTTAMAQQSADVEGLDNQEIVVTATRRDQGLNSVPAAVTAITSQQIEEATVRVLIVVEK